MGKVAVDKMEFDEPKVAEENLQTVALFNVVTSELTSFHFSLDDVFDRDRWDDVVINRIIVPLKKRA